jgi:hypothetical protein
MSKIEVNQISSQCGSTLTIGQSGDTIQLACGATQSGFGRSGSVNWDTTAKTAGFTAVSGNGYFVNTTSGAITATLPATPSAGDIVSIADYAATAATNNITIARNGSNINGDASDLTISENNSAITLVYVDGTQGWKSTETSNLSDIALQPEYIVASGGTVTCCGNYKIHTFTGPGTFTVCSAGNPAGSTTVDYLVVAGGGSGGTTNGVNGAGGGGGGAGGYRESSGAASGCYTVSPLGACVSALPVSVTAYPITVGGGGATEPFPQPGSSASNPGSNSVFSTITSTGGAGGTNYQTKADGGSGGGGADDGGRSSPIGGTGNTPPVSPPQGNPGGGYTANGPFYGSGGGGGATAAGVDGTPTVGGNGGAGATSSINGTPTTRAGGGGGGTYGGPGPGGTAGSGGPGGGGNGGAYPQGDNNVAGTANTGGGGGGIGSNPNGLSNYSGKAGGSGIVIIRYKFQ